MYNILRMDHEPEKRYDAQSEGASIFRPPKKCGFFMQWSFKTGTWMFYTISYLTGSYIFCKVKLQKDIILSDFRFENHLI